MIIASSDQLLPNLPPLWPVPHIFGKICQVLPYVARYATIGQKVSDHCDYNWTYLNIAGHNESI